MMPEKEFEFQVIGVIPWANIVVLSSEVMVI